MGLLASASCPVRGLRATRARGPRMTSALDIRNTISLLEEMPLRSRMEVERHQATRPMSYIKSRPMCTAGFGVRLKPLVRHEMSTTFL